MADGQLRCAGSSLFLKKEYGVGYQLTIEKARTANEKVQTDSKNAVDSDDDDDDVYIENGDSTLNGNGRIENGDSTLNGNGHMHKSVDVKQTVESAVPEATLLNDIGTEIRYQLPLGASSKFPAMFKSLDEETVKGNIASYGVSVTTLGESVPSVLCRIIDCGGFCFGDQHLPYVVCLFFPQPDEVFLLVARGDHADNQKTHLRSSQRLSADEMSGLNAVDDDDRSARSKMNLEKDGMFFRHLGALFKKRAANFRRDKRACTFNF